MALRIGLHHAEALVVGLLGVVAGEIDQRALVAALRNKNVHSCGAGALAGQLLREQVFQRLAIFEIDRHVDIPRNVGLADVELLQERREEFAGMK